MSKKRANSDKRKEKVEASNGSSIESKLHILPISHREFKSRWSLSKDGLDAGQLAAAQDGVQSHLVLRVYSLSANAAPSDYSEAWQDYSIDGRESNGRFTLAKPTPKIRAVIGLINDSGRFRPLVRGKAVPLPPSPDVLAAEAEAASKAADSEKEVTIKRPATDAELAKRLGLDPPLAQIGYHSPPSHAAGPKKAKTPRNIDDTTPQERFNQWEEIWTESAPIEIRAEFVVSGKIAPGMKILMGNQILEPDSDGYIEWKQRLGSFKQVWHLLEEALANPSVEAGPSLEFFKDAKSSKNLLELHAALKIAGKVNDPEYHSILPKELNADANGVFKLSRMLPDGAVILPGISLIAAK